MKVCTIRAFDLAVQMQGYRRKTTISQRAFWSHVQQEVEIKAHVLMLLKLCSIINWLKQTTCPRMSYETQRCNNVCQFVNFMQSISPLIHI